MDLASIVGFGTIALALLLTILSAFFNLPLPAFLKGLIDTSSLICVVGGMLGATLITFSMADFSNLVAVFLKVIEPEVPSPIALMKQLIEIGAAARRGGILSIEPMLEELDEEFLRKGLQMAVDGRDAETIRANLNGEVTFMATRHEKGAEIFNTMNKYCPAFGMIGTLFGLIAMLGSMSGGGGMDMNALTGGMAVALITTLYGAVFANAIFSPVADGLKSKSKAEKVYRDVIIEGVVMIASSETPPVMRARFGSFLAPKDQAQLLES
jgi:chemotaxis protein MotA